MLDAYRQDMYTQSTLTDIFILKDARIAPVGVLPSQLPNVKEWFPVNVLKEITEVIVFLYRHPHAVRTHYRIRYISGSTRFSVKC